MEILHIAYYTFKRNFKGGILRSVILPGIIILILGISLKTVYSANFDSKDNAIVFAQSDKEFSEFQSFIMHTESFKDNVILTRAKAEKEVIAIMKSNNKYDAGIILEGGKNIKLYTYQINSLDGSFFRSIVNSYGILKAANIKDNNKMASKVGIKAKMPSSMAYYSVTMIIMFTFYGALYGSDIVSEDKDNRRESKTASLPIKINKIIIGEVLGSTLLIFTYAVILILITKFAYGADWGNNYEIIILALLIFSFFSINFGTTIALIMKDSSSSEYIIQMLVPFFTIISGGYVTRRVFSEVVNSMSKFSPSFAVQNIIFKNIYHYSNNVGLFYLELVILGGVLFVITLLLGRRCIN